MVLLHLLSEWQRTYASDIPLKLIHINHQLSPNAEVWQQFVSEQASALGIACTVCVVEIDSKSRTSLEAQARDARYQAFASHCEKGSLLLLAHHQWDQIETVFIRLFRGSGPKGLKGMSAFSQRIVENKPIAIARPLLTVDRDQLSQYAQQQDIQWIEDESNHDARFDRNNIRHNLLETIRKQWPSRWQGMFSAITRSASLCADQQEVIDLLCEEKLQQAIIQPATLSRQALLKSPRVVQAELIRQWLDSLAIAAPSAAILEQVLNALQSDVDRQPVIQWQHSQIRIQSDWVYALPAIFPESLPIQTHLAQGSSIAWHNPWGESLTIAYAAQNSIRSIPENAKREASDFVIPADCNSRVLSLCSNIQSHRIRVREGQKVRALKAWLKEWQIASWYRDDVLGVFANDILLAVFDGQRFIKVMDENG